MPRIKLEKPRTKMPGFRLPKDLVDRFNQVAKEKNIKKTVILEKGIEMYLNYLERNDKNEI